MIYVSSPRNLLKRSQNLCNLVDLTKVRPPPPSLCSPALYISHIYIFQISVLIFQLIVEIFAASTERQTRDKVLSFSRYVLNSTTSLVSIHLSLSLSLGRTDFLINLSYIFFLFLPRLRSLSLSLSLCVSLSKRCLCSALDVLALAVDNVFRSSLFLCTFLPHSYHLPL